MPLCQSHLSLCADTEPDALPTYVGHDEPSVLFKSAVPGSGNDMTYTVTLPGTRRLSRHPAARPAPPGTSSSGRRSGSA